MTDNFTRSETPSDLERDAERVRAQIADTAEHLKDKMSPGQLMDEVVSYIKDGDASVFLSNIKTQVRDNPLALAMVGGGLAWLMMGSGAATPKDTPRPAASPGLDRSQGTSARAPGAAGIEGSALSGGVEVVRDGAASLAAAASHAAGSVKDQVVATTHDVRDVASDYLSSASRAGTDVGDRVKTTLLDALEREPLVLGAIGVAVGAAIGAMLPATRTEQEYLGKTARKVRDTAATAFSDGVEKAKDVASDVYSAARSEADRQGLIPKDQSISEKVAEVAKAAGSEIKSASRSALGEDSDTQSAEITGSPTGPKSD